ncbi:MAG: flippase-like domain-containing protein [Planctomycetaceae bacterium]|nr:flippase-like domain-containing protein [Planctomycetaceae bacterium]
MTKHPSRSKMWLLAAVKLAIVGIVLWAVGKTLLRGVVTLWKDDWQLHWPWIIAAGVIYLVGLLPAGMFWWRVLWVLGQRTRFLDTMRAYYIGHLGKYVPGKAMVVVLRAGLLQPGGARVSVAAAAVFFETLTMMAVGAFWAAAILAVWFRGHWTLCVLAVGLMLAAGIPTVPPLFRRLARLARVAKSDPETQKKLDDIGYGTLATGWITMTVCWGLLALSFWATLKAMGIEGLDLIRDFPRYLASVSLAMVAGFLSLIPGGLFVRDGILAELVEPYFRQLAIPLAADVAAGLSAVLLRIVWLVAEVVISGILYFGFRPRGPIDAG